MTAHAQIKTLVHSLLATLAALLLVGPAAAQTAAPQAKDGTIIIATHEAPPFAIHQPDGEWKGLAIDLWAGIAKDMGIPYRIIDTDVRDMVGGVADGHYDASVGALTVTPEREARIDFSHPFFSTGFGIVTAQAPPEWLILFRNFFTWGFLQAVLALGAVLMFVGLLFWAVERRANEDFGGKASHGIGSGFWFSAVTMTTVGYGDKAPRTLAGKIIAIIWMFAAILIISTFTGLIASALTEGKLNGSIRTADDLSSASVGTISGTAADDWLAGRRIGFTGYPSVKTGIDAVESGDIDAFVYDRPLLAYRLKERNAQRLRLLPATFGRQDYAFALPQGDPRREEINRRLLERIDSEQWSDLIRQTIGEGE